MLRDESTEIAKPVELFNPRTGELVPLAAPTQDLGALLVDIREIESQLREHKRAASREILRRFDSMASWTHRFEGGLKITGQSPQPTEEWNGAELKEALLDLVDEGALSVEAVDAAVETVVSYRVKKAGVSKLRKVGGEPAAVVNRLCVTSEPERRVSVSRERM